MARPISQETLKPMSPLDSFIYKTEPNLELNNRVIEIINPNPYQFIKLNINRSTVYYKVRKTIYTIEEEIYY